MSRLRHARRAGEIRVDASVIPRIPYANVELTCYLIGARVADFLA